MRCGMFALRQLREAAWPPTPPLVWTRRSARGRLKTCTRGAEALHAHDGRTRGGRTQSRFQSHFPARYTPGAAPEVRRKSQPESGARSRARAQQGMLTAQLRERSCGMSSRGGPDMPQLRSRS
jgi:hypothetical protein